MSNGWTPERRAKQAKLIQTWRPWLKSTGAKTQLGKQVVSMNAYKGGTRKRVRAMLKFMKKQREFLAKVNERHTLTLY